MKEVEFLKYLLENIINNPEDIKIESSEDELGVLLTLSVNKEDMWLIIWKWWNTINSIRLILRVLWTKLWKKINLKVLG